MLLLLSVVALSARAEFRRIDQTIHGLD